MELDDEVKELIEKILLDPKNIASPSELNQQAKACLAALSRADTDENHIITYDEIGTLCEILGLPVQDEESFEQYDTNGTGTLENNEFLEWWLRRVSVLPGTTKQQEVLAKNTFLTFDKDHSGSINISEFNDLILSLGTQFTSQELSDAIRELDQDGSGLIEMNEFVSWWINHTQNVRKGGGLIAYKLKKLIKKAVQLYSTDIFAATWNHQVSLVQLFLESNPALINSLDRSEYGNEWSVLHYAAYKGYDDLVSLFLETPSVQVNIRNKDGFTPLFYSLQQQHDDVSLLLLSAGADPTLSGYDPSPPQSLCRYLTLDSPTEMNGDDEGKDSENEEEKEQERERQKEKEEGDPENLILPPPLCSLDLLVDCTNDEIRSLLLTHENSKPPISRPILQQISLSISGQISLSFSNYTKISNSPIISFDINFFVSSPKSVLELSVKYFKQSNYLSATNVITFRPSVKQLEKIMREVGRVEKERRKTCLECLVRPYNRVGRGDFSERVVVDLSEIVGK